MSGFPDRGPTPPRLATKIGAGMILSAAIPCIALGLVIGLSFRLSLVREIDASARSLNTAISQSVHRNLGITEEHLRVLAESASEGSNLEPLRTAMDLMVNAQAEMKRILALDADGRLVLGIPEEPGSVIRDFSGLRFEDRTEFDTRFSRAFLSPFDGQVSAYLARDIPETFGIARIVIELNLEELSSFLMPLRIFGDDMIAILDDTNRYIAHTVIRHVREQGYESETALAETGHARFRRDGTTWLAWSRAIPGTPWRVVYYRNEERAFAVFKTEILITLLVTVSFAVAAFLSVFKLGGSIDRAIALYSRKAEAVSRGNYGTPLPPPYREFSGLSDSIESMARSVMEREATLRKTVEVREQLLREIHHRVKNNLQIIISLLTLERSGLARSGQGDAFNRSVDRIRSMSLIHETLYEQENLDSIDVSEFASTLVDQLVSAYGRTDVRLTRAFRPVRLPMDAAIPFGIILNELVTNALKHGTRPDAVPALEVRFGVEDGWCELSVSDRGPGRKTGAPNDSGLGLSIARALSLQLEGSLALSSGADGFGTVAVVRFPAPANAAFPGDALEDPPA